MGLRMDRSALTVLRKIWSDPVWSKVISAGIIAGVSWVLLGNSLVKVLLIAAWLGLWIFFVYVRYSKEAARIIAPSASSVFKFGHRMRRLAISSMITLLIIPIGYPIFLYIAHFKPKKIVVLVAHLDGPDASVYRVTETLLDQLQEETAKYPDIRLEKLDEALSIKDQDKARSVGNEREASIVIWGWYTRTAMQTRISYHVEVLSATKLLVLKGQQETLILKVQALDSFEAHDQLSAQLTYLALLIAGLSRFEARDYAGALDRLTAAIRQQSIPEKIVNPAMAYAYRSLLYLDSEEFDKAIADSNEVISRLPNYAPAYNTRGASQLAKGYQEEAISDLTKAIALAPNYSASYFNRGLAYKREGQLELSIADYNKCIELDTKSAESYVNRGNVFEELGQFDNAVVDYNKAIDLKPEKSFLAIAYNNRGKAYLDRDNDHALVDINQAIELDPDFAMAYINRAHVYSDAGLYDKALIEIDHAISLNPNLAISYVDKGMILSNKGGYEQALAEFNHAMELDPKNAESYVARGHFYSLWGEVSDAESDYATALTLTFKKRILEEAHSGLSKLPGLFKPEFENECIGSGHEYGEAFDISAIGDWPISDYTKNPEVKKRVDILQEISNRATDDRSIDENYGPAGLFKNGKRIFDQTLEANHRNHIHIRVRGKVDDMTEYMKK